MEVFGSGPISADALRFWSSKEAVATVDETGTITAGSKPGTATITAAIMDDPLNRRVSVKVKVIAAQICSLELIPDLEAEQASARIFRKSSRCLSGIAPIRATIFSNIVIMTFAPSLCKRISARSWAIGAGTIT